LIDYCLTSNEQHFNYIQDENSSTVYRNYIEMREG